MRVQVMDGSDTPLDKEVTTSFSPNITYSHAPGSFGDRIFLGSKRIETDYVALIADDDFFLLEGLNECITTLQADSQLVSCMGRAIGVSFDDGSARGWPIYTAMAGYKNIDSDPLTRLLSHMNNYMCSSIYAVTRRDAWQIASAVLPKVTSNIYAIEEIIFEMVIPLLGKSKVLDKLMWVRGANLESETSNPSLGTSRYTFFPHWWRSRHSMIERGDFISTLSDAVTQVASIDKQVLSSTILAAGDSLSDFLSRKHSSLPLRTTRFRQQLRNLRNKLIATNPHKTSKSFLDRPLMTSPEFIDEMIRAGVAVTHNDIQLFLDLVRQASIASRRMTKSESIS